VELNVRPEPRCLLSRKQEFQAPISLLTTSRMRRDGIGRSRLQDTAVTDLTFRLSQFLLKPAIKGEPAFRKSVSTTVRNIIISRGKPEISQ
jgi:hypothetical protein